MQKNGFILILAVAGLLSAPALSEDSVSPGLQEIQQKLDQWDSDDCSEIFDYLWPEAKAGNQYARGALIGMVVGVGLNMPGRGMDYISRLRDYQILSVYSADTGVKNEDVLVSPYIESFREYDEFYQCYKAGKTNCSLILVDGQIIPSFEDYAKEIDVFLEAGYGPSCFGGFDSRSEEYSVSPEIDGSE